MLAITRMTGLPEEAGMKIPGPKNANVKGTAENPFIKLLTGLTNPEKTASAEAKIAGKQKITTGLKSRNTEAATQAGTALRQLQGVETGKARDALEARTPDINRTVQARASVSDAGSGAVAGTGRASAKSKDLPVRDAAGEASVVAALVASGAEHKVAVNPSPIKASNTAKSAVTENSGIETLGTGTEKGKDGARVVVVDMRMKAGLEVTARRDSVKSRSEARSRDEASTMDSGKNEKTFDAARVGDHMVASSDRVPEQGQAPALESTAPSPKTMSESLASRLRDGAADIVRSAQIVLRDGNSGLIRLRLEPESLGGVKIELKMTEKQISGKIVVESDIAGEAFRSSLDALKDAFAESGFETTSLEVEVRNGMAYGAEAGNHGTDGTANDGGPYWSESLRQLDDAVPTVISRSRDGLLDFLV